MIWKFKKKNLNSELSILKFNLASYVFLSLIISCSPVKFTVDDSEKKTVPPSPCETSTCNTEEGPYAWRVGSDWGMCSQACGGGTQDRAIYCMNPKDQKFPDNYCAENKPATSQSCNTNKCPGDTTTTVEIPVWNYGNWNACSVTCGGGAQSRIVECRKKSGVVADTECTDQKPALSQECNTQACPINTISKTKSVTVPSDENKLDILLVIDDSSSMEADSAKLASRMSTFVNQLQNVNVDWRMCITSSDTYFYEGRPIQWSKTSTRYLSKDTKTIDNESGQLNSIFQQTVWDIFHINGTGSNDERGVRAAILSLLLNPTYPCYRTGAAIAVIVISDEDERSTGGSSAYSSTQVKQLTIEDFPATYVNYVKATFGANKRMATNAIVVKDETCRQQQNAEGSPSFIGTKYIELANYTNGTTGSICDNNYSSNLSYFKEAILHNLSSVELECIPYGAANVSIPNGYTYTITGKEVTFTPALSGGTTVTINYQCKE